MSQRTSTRDETRRLMRAAEVELRTSAHFSRTIRQSWKPCSRSHIVSSRASLLSKSEKALRPYWSSDFKTSLLMYDGKSNFQTLS